MLHVGRAVAPGTGTSMQDGGRIDVRRANAADSAAIAALCAQLGYPTAVAAIASRLEGLLASAEHLVLVGVHGGRVSGWLHAAVTRVRIPVMSVRDSGFMSVHDSGACRYARAG